MKRIILIGIILIQGIYPQSYSKIIRNKLPDSIDRQFEIKQTKIKVATYNTGMLSTDVVSVPFYRDRLNRMNEMIADYLDRQKPSVMFFQEIWHGKTNIELEKAARKAGYLPVLSIPHNITNSLLFENNHGLQILIASEILNLASDFKQGFYPLKQEESYICGFGLICRRGVGYAILTIGSRKFLFATFHLTPLLSEIKKRKTEIREIISFLYSQNVDYIIIGADFNYSLKFDSDNTKNREKEKWQKNSEIYTLWLDLWKNAGYSCDDSWISANPEDPGYTIDVNNNLVAATGQVTKDEPSQRIDQIWTCGRNLASIEINRSSLIFKNRFINHENRKIELSDHYGVESEFFFYSIEGIYIDENSIAARPKNKIKTAVINQ